jgi:hypothetical protein
VKIKPFVGDLVFPIPFYPKTVVKSQRRYFMTKSKPIDFVERNNIKSFLALLRDWMAIFLIAAFSIWANNIFIYLVAVWFIGIFKFALGEA